MNVFKQYDKLTAMRYGFFLKKLTARLPAFLRNFLQKIILTIQLTGKNGLFNHAAACAYGFLFSMAPMLLLVFLVIYTVYARSPEAFAAYVSNIPFMDNLFDRQRLINDFFLIARPGVSGLISVLSILWAARILAISVQRGLKIIFPHEKQRNPISNSIITLAIETSVLLLLLIMITGSMTVFRFYMLIPILHRIPILHIIVSRLGRTIFFIFLLGAISFFAYLLVPVKSPRKTSALQGALLGIFAYSCTALILSYVTDVTRYNFIYGALGDIIILLVNVFFFFVFFFIGAQFAYVTDSFEILFFSAMRKIKIQETKSKKKKLMRFLLDPCVNGLSKYLKNYKKGDAFHFRSDDGDLIYYLHEGKIEILYPENHCEYNEILESGSFFGETGHLLSESHPISITAKTSVSVLALPLHLFETILKTDMDIDREIIEHITNRLKHHSV